MRESRQERTHALLTNTRLLTSMYFIGGCTKVPSCSAYERYRSQHCRSKHCRRLIIVQKDSTKNNITPGACNRSSTSIAEARTPSLHGTVHHTTPPPSPPRARLSLPSPLSSCRGRGSKTVTPPFFCVVSSHVVYSGLVDIDTPLAYYAVFHTNATEATHATRNSRDSPCITHWRRRRSERTPRRLSPSPPPPPETQNIHVTRLAHTRTHTRTHKENWRHPRAVGTLT